MTLNEQYNTYYGKGDTVKVKDNGHTYSSYRDMAKHLGIKKWVCNKLPKNDNRYIIMNMSGNYVYIEDPEEGIGYVIDIKGLKKIEFELDLELFLV